MQEAYSDGSMRSLVRNYGKQGIDCRAAIAVKEGSRTNTQIQSSLESASGRGVPEWLTLDAANFTGKVQALPSREDIKLPIQEQLIVELYSR